MDKPSADPRRQDGKPERALVRPEPADWGHEELMTLAEAAAVFWPNGPLTTTSLRTAVRDGQLATATIAGKIFTCPRAIREMAVFEKRAEPTPGRGVPERTGADPPPANQADPVASQDRLLDDHDRLKAAVDRIDADAGGRSNGGRIRPACRSSRSARAHPQS